MLAPLGRRLAEAVTFVAVSYGLALGLLAPGLPQWRLAALRRAPVAAAALSRRARRRRRRDDARAGADRRIRAGGAAGRRADARRRSAAHRRRLSDRHRRDAPREAVATTPARRADGRDWILSRCACSPGPRSPSSPARWRRAMSPSPISCCCRWPGSRRWARRSICCSPSSRPASQRAFQPATPLGAALVSGLRRAAGIARPLRRAADRRRDARALRLRALRRARPLWIPVGRFLRQSADRSIPASRSARSSSRRRESRRRSLSSRSPMARRKALRRWLDQRFLPLTRLDKGLRHSIGASIGYAGFIARRLGRAGRARPRPRAARHRRRRALGRHRLRPAVDRQ